MSSSYKPEVGDIVIPSTGVFIGLRCRVAVVCEGSVGVECLESGAEGHTLDGYLSKRNGWWYPVSVLNYEGKENSGFKVGDRVASPDYSERGPGTVKKSDCPSLILVEHDDIFENGHDGDGACIYGTGWYYNESEIQIVHEVKPEPKSEPEPQFKVGDVVESKGYNHRGPGVILKIQPSGAYAVEHFKHIKTHSCLGLGKDGHCWNYEKNEIFLSSTTKPEPEPKPDKPQEVKSLHGYSLGDRVKGRYGPGTVVHFTQAGSIGVEHDKHNGSHSCGGHGRKGYCWYFKSGEIEKLEPISLDTVGSGSIGMSGAIVGSSGSTVSNGSNRSIPLMWDSYAGFGPGIWSEIRPTEESKKPKSSVDKYIQDPIISKKTKKKKSLVIV